MTKLTLHITGQAGYPYRKGHMLGMYAGRLGVLR